MIELETNIGHRDENVASQRSRPSRADVQIGPGEIAVCTAIFQVPLIVEVWIIRRCRIGVLMPVGPAHNRITGDNPVLAGQSFSGLNRGVTISSLENEEVR